MTNPEQAAQTFVPTACLSGCPFRKDALPAMAVRHCRRRGGTLVEVEHRNLERFGEAAGEISSTFKSEGGFTGMLKTYKKVVEG